MLLSGKSLSQRIVEVEKPVFTIEIMMRLRPTIFSCICALAIKLDNNYFQNEEIAVVFSFLYILGFSYFPQCYAHYITKMVD